MEQMGSYDVQCGMASASITSASARWCEWIWYYSKYQPHAKAQDVLWCFVTDAQALLKALATAKKQPHPSFPDIAIQKKSAHILQDAIATL